MNTAKNVPNRLINEKSPYLLDVYKRQAIFFSYASAGTVLTQDDVPEKMLQAMLIFAKSAFPLLLIGVATAVAVTLFQTRMAFSMENLKRCV